jgi:hypothetical protein
MDKGAQPGNRLSRTNRASVVMSRAVMCSAIVAFMLPLADNRTTDGRSSGLEIDRWSPPVLLS